MLYGPRDDGIFKYWLACFNLLTQKSAAETDRSLTKARARPHSFAEHIQVVHGEIVSIRAATVTLARCLAAQRPRPDLRTSRFVSGWSAVLHLGITSRSPVIHEFLESIRTSQLISTDLQACPRRHWFEIMDRIAKGLEDVKKSGKGRR